MNTSILSRNMKKSRTEALLGYNKHKKEEELQQKELTNSVSQPNLKKKENIYTKHFIPGLIFNTNENDILNENVAITGLFQSPIDDFESHKESYIIENSNYMSDYYSIMVEKDSMFPENVLDKSLNSSNLLTGTNLNKIPLTSRSNKSDRQLSNKLRQRPIGTGVPNSTKNKLPTEKLNNKNHDEYNSNFKPTNHPINKENEYEGIKPEQKISKASLDKYMYLFGDVSKPNSVNINYMNNNLVLKEKYSNNKKISFENTIDGDITNMKNKLNFGGISSNNSFAFPEKSPRDFNKSFLKN